MPTPPFCTQRQDFGDCPGRGRQVCAFPWHPRAPHNLQFLLHHPSSPTAAHSGVSSLYSTSAPAHSTTASAFICLSFHIHRLSFGSAARPRLTEAALGLSARPPIPIRTADASQALIGPNHTFDV